MKKLSTILSIIVFLALVVAVGYVLVTNNSVINNDLESSVLVVSVVDGDTIDVDILGSVTRVRLIGIDTPETVDPRRAVECFGVEASKRTKSMLLGHLVRLERDMSQGDMDKYGRLLRYLFLENGVNYNESMIRAGYAHEYTYDLPYYYQAEFILAEDYARENELGLWGIGVCDN